MDSEACDILIVGSGAAGLAAAANTGPGLRTIVVEQGSTVGGTTARSGGTIWIPGSSVSQDLGVQDDLSLAAQYLDALRRVPKDDDNDVLPSARRDAYLEVGPKMVAYLRAWGFQWSSKLSTYPDYQPVLPGSFPVGGRTLDPAIFDTAALKDWYSLLVPPGSPRPPILVPRFQDLAVLSRPKASIWDIIAVIWILFKTWLYRLIYRNPVSMGMSLIAQLLYICRRTTRVKIYTNTTLVKLTAENGVATGGIVRREGRDLHISARKGILLATAGFSRNLQFREKLMGKPSNPDWSLTQESGDKGSNLQLARPLGAAVANLDKLWGIPTMKDPLSGTTTSALFEISKPHSIVVDEHGLRFFCEARPYGDAVDAMTRHLSPTSAFWLIVDSNYRRRYMLGSLAPGQEAADAIVSGHLLEADNIPSLAESLGIPPQSLEKTISRWNVMCQIGRDSDFGRGSDEYQRFIGDPSIKPNPNMGPISTGPFYAFQVFPGDAGTRGGLATDQYARVLNEDGAPIDGLYSAGNASASIITGSAPGAGATLGPGMVFGHIAVDHMMSRPEEE